MDLPTDSISSIGSHLKPVRRKLQKSATKPKEKEKTTTSKAKGRSLWSTKRDSQDSTSGALECGGGNPSIRHISSGGKPSIPMPPDLSDSKWLEYIERSGLMSSPELPLGLGSRAKVNTEPPSSLLPDFPRLSLSRSSPRQSLDSTSNMSPPNMHKPRKPRSKRSIIGPIFKIGSCEDASPPKPKDIRVVKRKASVELIAEQYQAFLESRDAKEEEEQELEEENERRSSATSRNSHPDEVFVLEPTRYEPKQESSIRKRSDDRPREVFLDAPGPAEGSNLSPASDGTLVAFEEDAIYFKPVSFSPPPSPSPQRRSFDRKESQPSSSHGEQHLQTALVLLINELTGALPPNNAQRNHGQALQIGVMIEAYERLRDQVAGMGLGDSERQNVSAMFDCWLSALYSMHRSFTSNAAAHEHRYEEMTEALD